MRRAWRTCLSAAAVSAGAWLALASSCTKSEKRRIGARIGSRGGKPRSTASPLLCVSCAASADVHPPHAGGHFEVEVIAMRAVVVGRQEHVEELGVGRLAHDGAELGR
jgi:hypothetical protein